MRLFLAAELPASVRRCVSDVQGRLRDELKGWRWVRPESIHLTLRFLGEVDEQSDERARGAWRDVARACGPFRLRVTGVGRFPERGTPRVLWVGLEEIEPGEGMARLVADLERNARELGWQPEKRPFRPHLTLARRLRGARPGAPPDGERVPAAEGWVRRIVLFRSRLDRSGARYTAMASYPLGDAEDGDEAAGSRTTGGREAE